MESSIHNKTCQWATLLQLHKKFPFLFSFHVRLYFFSLERSIRENKSNQKGKAKEETLNNEINKNEKLQFRMEQLDKQITFFEKEARRLKEKVSTLELQKEGLLTRYCYDRHILKIEILSIKLNDIFPI